MQIHHPFYLTFGVLLVVAAIVLYRQYRQVRNTDADESFLVFGRPQRGRAQLILVYLGSIVSATFAVVIGVFLILSALKTGPLIDTSVDNTVRTERCTVTYVYHNRTDFSGMIRTTCGEVDVQRHPVLARQLQQGYTYMLTYTTEGGLLELRGVKEIARIVAPAS
jgi:hypothetical protein